MNNSICPKCGVQNPPGMSFCSNCGQPLAVAAPQQQGGNMPKSNAPEPAPTIVSYQPGFTSPAPNAAAQFSPSVNSSPPVKKGGRGLLFGLLGCGGLLLVSVIGLIVGIPLLQRAEILPQPLFGGSSSPTPGNSNIAGYNSNSRTANSNLRIANSNSATTQNGNSSSSKLLSEMQGYKQVGSFKQTEVKAVDAKSFFPSAAEVVQATYTDGSQYVVSTNGVFPSNENAAADFDTQIRNIKNNGGTIYSNQAKDGVQSSFYKHKDFYFIEVCSQATCSRNNSSDLNALKSFVISYGGTLNNSSAKSGQSSSIINMVGLWKGQSNSQTMTVNITKQDGEAFSGTFILSDGVTVEFEGHINNQTRGVSMKETKVLKEPRAGSWSLGDNNGTISENGKTMSGKGQDKVNPPYNWSFTKQ